MRFKTISIYIVIFFILTYMVGLKPAFASYGSTIIRDNPVSYWRLGEPSGLGSPYTAHDEMGHNDAFYQWTGYFTLGRPGALTADPNTALGCAASGYLRLDPIPASLQLGNGAQSYEMWFKRTQWATNEYLLVNATDGAPTITLDPDGYVYFFGRNSGVWNTQSAQKIQDTNWHYLVATKATTDLWSIFVDGVAGSSAPNGTAVTPSYMLFGGSFTGDIDEVAVYNTALTQAQITNHYYAGITSTGPLSGSYQLINYGFGAGGTTNSNSTSYQMQGILGEVETASLSSSHYMVWPGLLYTTQPNVPPAPAFINPGGNSYNLLNLTINQGNNPSDTTYAIAVTTDPAIVNNIKYVQSDNTLGASPIYQSYTAWWATGGATSGTNIIGLIPGTTYYAMIRASRGTFTQGPFGPVSSAATVNPTFTFNLQTTNQAVPPYTVGIGVVNAGQVTTSWQKVIATITTNAAKGGTVYINGANAGLKSATAGNYVISSTQNDLSSGGVTEGYGARGISVSASAGTMELLNPYNLSGNNVGPVNTSKNPIADSTSAPITSGTVNFELKAKAGASTPAANDYADTITVVASGSF